MRLANSVMDSDLENVKALVGDIQSKSTMLTILIVTRPSTDLPPVNLASMNPSSRNDFIEYAELLKKKFAQFEVSLLTFYLARIIHLLDSLQRQWSEIS